jgi:hypothetical protein
MNRDFRLEQHPIVLMRPSVVPPFGWVGHIPFVYLAVDLLRPASIVELGTHSGNSYLAMCQAVQALDLPTRCSAIDTWQGDSHASHYGEQVFQTLRSRHDPRYGGFSRLIRSQFDEALGHFADRSVDLLHIDGLHTYEAVRHDFEAWLPKLSERAVVLLHDTATDERGFGVRAFFDELAKRYPCFGFNHSNGLGVVCVGTNVPEPFFAFMQHAQANPTAIRGFFEAQAANLVDVHGRAQGGLYEPQPVVCHLYYRRSDESYDDARKISVEVDIVQGVLDVEFRLPQGVAPDYLRVDPSDHPGVYGLRQIRLGRANGVEARPLEQLSQRLGHVEGELLQRAGTQGVCFASFDDDPYVEFEVGSVLADHAGHGAVEVVIRIDYEVVLVEPSSRRLIERYGLADLRERARARLDIQGLSREMSQQFVETSQRLAETNARLSEIERCIDGLAKRSIWSWFRRGGR